MKISAKLRPITMERKDAFYFGKTSFNSVVEWGNRKPYPELIRLVRELRTGDKTVNFPRIKRMDDLLFSDCGKPYYGTGQLLKCRPAPCKEWVVYGPEGKPITRTVQFSDDGWTSVVDGISPHDIEKYNALIRSGNGAALFIRIYNNGESLPSVDEGKKKIEITPSKGGVSIIPNFLRGGKVGKVHILSRLAVKGNKVSDLDQRRNYTVDNNLSFAGPIVRDDNYYYGYYTVVSQRHLNCNHSPYYALGMLVESKTRP